MRWSRATVDRWAARGVPFAVTFKRIDKIMFYALDGIHGHTSQDHRFPSEQRSVKLALAGVVLQYGGGPHGKGRCCLCFLFLSQN
jgi:hypothetical protein